MIKFHAQQQRLSMIQTAVSFALTYLPNSEGKDIFFKTLNIFNRGLTDRNYHGYRSTVCTGVWYKRKTTWSWKNFIGRLGSITNPGSRPVPSTIIHHVLHFTEVTFKFVLEVLQTNWLQRFSMEPGATSLFQRRFQSQMSQQSPKICRN